MNLTPELGKLIAVAITSDTKYWLQYLLIVCLATWVKVTRHYMSIFLNYLEEGIAISAQLPVTKNEGNSCFSLTMNSTKARSSLRTELYHADLHLNTTTCRWKCLLSQFALAGVQQLFVGLQVADQQRTDSAPGHPSSWSYCGQQTSRLCASQTFRLGTTAGALPRHAVWDTSPDDLCGNHPFHS